MFEFLLATNNVTGSGVVIAFMLLFVLHFIADFMMQTDEIAKGKSTSNRVLSQHVAIYTIPFLIVYGPIFAAITIVSHWCTDYVSSRAASKAFLNEERHKFFVIIGFDQLLHTLQLIITFAFVMYIVGVYPNL